MKKSRLSEELKNTLIKLLKEGKTYNEIQCSYNVSKSTLGRLCKKHSIIYNIPSQRKHDYDEILKLVNEGYRPVEISKLLNIPMGTIPSILSKYGYRFLPEHKNIRFFKTINSHVKAYFLGFIAADGCIQHNGANSYGLSITIHSKDKHLLERLKNEFQSNLNIYHITTKMSHTNKNKDHVRLAIFNKLLYNDILKYGITPNKSLTMPNLIPNIPKQFRKSFILGYFDGDGSVMRQNQIRIKKGKSYPSRGLTIQIRGTKKFLLGIVDELNILNYSIRFDKTHSLIFSKKSEIIKFFECYKNSNIFLPRKRDIFLERMSHKSWDKFIQVQTISLPNLKI